MKKLLILGLLSAGLSVNAAEMSFITVLSSPVGTFNRLEAVDFSAPATASTVNFCTKVGSSGSVQLKGLQSASLGAVALASDTRLGRSGSGDYVLNSIRLNSNGTVQGGRLLANRVIVSGQGVGKSNNLYGTTLTLAGAKTTNLNVGSGNSVMSGTGSAKEMVWSNEYQSDNACKDGSACAKQYLLKTKGSAVSPGGGVHQPFYTYQWYCARDGSIVDTMPNNRCRHTCPLVDPNVTDIGTRPIGTQPQYPLFLPANVFGKGKVCDINTLNDSCFQDEVKVGTMYYCVKCTCTEIEQ